MSWRRQGSLRKRRNWRISMPVTFLIAASLFAQAAASLWVWKEQAVSIEQLRAEPLLKPLLDQRDVEVVPVPEEHCTSQEAAETWAEENTPLGRVELAVVWCGVDPEKVYFLLHGPAE